MLVCEIGLNHLGDEKYASEYVSTILTTDIDAITFQIREPEFYVKKYLNYMVIKLIF